jgi:hypothetical protein
MSKIPKGRNRHHLKQKHRGGRSSKNNLLLIHIEKHEAYHRLFHDLNLDEVIALLKRLRRAKRKQRVRSY